MRPNQRNKQKTVYRFTPEEMSIAKETDLPDLLSHLGYQVRRLGSYHTTKEMDSIRIKERRRWRRYSTGQGGDAISSSQSPLSFISACRRKLCTLPCSSSPHATRFAGLARGSLVPGVLRQELPGGGELPAGL